MKTIKEIIGNSAIGNVSKIYQTLVLGVFATIVVASISMLAIVIKNAQQVSIGFGY